jgi:hypothetical protein
VTDDRLPAVVVHRWELERRIRRHRSRLGETFDYPQIRFVCSCGARTYWMKDECRARKARDAHALDGQLGLS